MKNLEGQTTNIAKLFSRDFFFNIPDYQRPFSWDEDNFQDLINDIMTAERDQEYFLGTLVLHHTDNLNNYDVVDGQQRLTSLMILLACIRDLITTTTYKIEIQERLLQKQSVIDDIPEKPRLSVKDREIFRATVLLPDGTKGPHELTKPEPEYRYINAIKIFREKLQPLSEPQLQELVRFISMKCVLIYLATSTFDDAFKLFTIVNDRGKQLRRIDILKAENIAPGVVSSSSVRDRIAQRWETLEKTVGEEVFESILHLMRIIYVKEKPQGDLLKEFENRIFKTKKLIKGEVFTDEVFKTVELYQSIFIDKDILEEDESVSNKFKALMHIMHNEFVASEWRACVLSFTKKFGKASLYKFLLTIEKIYLEQWTQGVRKDERFSRYATILATIESSSKAADVISSMKFDADKIVEAISKKNFYGLSYSKFFLLRLELLASEHDVVKEFSAKSIEHVFPQNPDPTSNWAKDPDYLNRNELTDTIGNLVLLSKAKNASASNYEFQLKKEKYLSKKVTDYPRSAQILKYSNWTLDTIKSRNEEIKASILNDI